MNFKTIENHITQLPIYQYAFVDVNDIEFNDKARNICKKECTNYGKSWSCPPAIGPLKHCKNKCMDYSHVVLFSTTGEISNRSNREEILNSKREHEELTESIENFLKSEVLKCFTLSTDVCTICEKCTYPKKSCLNPDRMHPCIESHGISLSKILEKSNMDFFMGENMLLWFSMIFIKEA